MDADDRLRLDYEQTTQLMRTLTDIRFKLLAFVPTIAGATVAFVGRVPAPSAELLAVGLLGLVSTLGIFLWELRNVQLLDGVVRRAEALERRLGLASVLDGEAGPGGMVGERPPQTLTLFGMLGVRHEHGLGLVYGAALGGWTYLVVWGLLKSLDVGGARTIGGVVGVVAGLVVYVEVARFGARAAAQPDEAASAAGSRPA
jgi:hypothetical protein